MAINREAAKPVYYWHIHPVERYVVTKMKEDSLCTDVKESQVYAKFIK